MTKKQKESLPPQPAHVSAPPAEEVVHVPKGTSRLRFLLMFFGAIFVLIVLAAGDYLPALFSRNPASEVYLSWERPGHGVQRYTGPEYIQIRRAIEDFYRVQGENPRLDDDMVAYHIVTHALAQDAGIEVTKAEMGKAILSGGPGMRPFFSRQAYEGRLQAAGVTRVNYELMLREIMRVRRFELMVLSTLALPTPSNVEKSWKQQNKEYAFQGAAVALADMQEEAAATPPPDADLQAWLDGKQDRKTLFAEHWRVDRYNAEIIGWREGVEDPSALIAAYPPLPDIEIVDGRRYYDAFAHVCYKREKPLEPDPADPDPDADPKSRLYLPFEEVAARAEVSAKVFMAIESLIKDINTRTAAGETVDYEALAKSLGLYHENVPETHTQAEWSGEGGARPSELANPFFAGGIAMSGVDGNPKRQILSDKGIFLARVPERVRAGLPPVTEEPFRQAVLGAWAKEQAVIKGREKLAALRQELFPAGTSREVAAKELTAEKFTSAAQVKGFTAAAADWLDPRELAKQDEAGLDPLHKLLRAQQLAGGAIFQLEAGGLSEPLEGPGELLWLLRSEGSREPAEVDLRPAELEDLQMTAAFEGAGAMEKVLGAEAYKSRYKLAFKR